MRTSILSAGGALALLVAVGRADAAPKNNHRLDATFEQADKNKDGYLDADELAKTFRGPNAKPIEDKPGAKVEIHPDHVFLNTWDANKDGKIGKAEFEKYEAKVVAQSKSSYSRGGRSRHYSPYSRGGYRAGKSHHRGRRLF